jgi:uncharacterized LabA/DUF88 family protein
MPENLDAKESISHHQEDPGNIVPENINSETARRALRREGLRADFTAVVGDYILQNGGPDTDGRAHPRVNRINVEILVGAIAHAESLGLPKGFKPYHFVGHYGTWNVEKLVDEVIKKKVDQLLDKEFKGDMLGLLEENIAALRSPLIDKVAGKDIEVSILAIGQKFSNSPYKIILRYCDIKSCEPDGQLYAQFAKDVRPYHMKSATKGTFDDPKLIDEVLKKKLDQLLEGELCGDMNRLVELDARSLLSPLIDKVLGKDVEVSLSQVGHKFNDSPYEMVSRYCRIKSGDPDGVKFAQFGKELRPYHMRSASRGTFDDPKVIDEVLKKKVDQILERELNGDIHRLIEVSKDSLLSPLIDKVADKEVEVSLAQVMHRFKNSPYKMVVRYCELKNAGPDGDIYAQFGRDLRTYHMRSASKGTFNDPKLVDEILQRKIDQILERDFNGDFHRLVEVKKESLISPLIVKVAGKEVEVSMSQVQQKFGNSRYEMLKRYHHLKGKAFPL